MNQPKPEFPQKLLNEFLDAYDEVNAAPDGDLKTRMRQEIDKEYMNFLHQYERPVHPMEVEKPLIGALDYLPGAIRTIGGEAALGLTGHGDMKRAGHNLYNALVPFSGELAPTSKEYLNRGGVGGETPLSQTDLGKSMGVRPGAWYDVTPKGVGATALDVLASPETLQGLKGLISPKRPPGSLAEAELAHAAEVGKSGMRVAGEKAAQMFTSPSDALADLMARWRFRQANRATAAKGRRAYSDVWREHGAPGAPTADGQARAAENIIAEETEAKKGILNRVPRGSKTLLSSVVDPAFQDPDFQSRASAIGDTEAYDAAQKAVRDDIQHTLDKRATPATQAPTGILGNNGQPVMQPVPPVSPTMAQTSVDVHDLERLARTSQDKAMAARQYAKPGIGAVKNLTDLKMTPANGAYGELWADIGMNARDAQAKLLDRIEPGLGGQMFEANKDISSAATGAPFINRKFNLAGNASSRAKDWAGEMRPSGWMGIPLGLAVEGFDAARTAAAQGLNSDITKHLLVPAARAKWSASKRERDKMSPWHSMDEVEKSKPYIEYIDPSKLAPDPRGKEKR